MLALSFMLLCSPTLFAQTVANMDSLKAEKKTTAISLKLTGNLTTQGNSDFRQMRDLCWQLRNVDLSEATCPVIPKNAFILAIICKKFAASKSAADWFAGFLCL